MARPDWNLSWYTRLPNMFYATNVSTSCRGSTRSLRTQATTSGSDLGYIWTYNGNPYGDPNEGKFADGSISVASRLGVGAHSDDGAHGVIARCPWLNTGLTSTAYRQYYLLGNYNDHTEGYADAGNWLALRLWRVNNTSKVQLATTSCRVVNNSFVQYELQCVNVGGSVQLNFRYNNSNATDGNGILSVPGSDGWTNFSTLYTDATPGNLINPGYWGFGWHAMGSSGGGTLTDQFAYYDHMTIYRGIP